MNPLLTGLCATALLLSTPLQTLNARQAKLLQLGWCQPDSTFLRDHWEQIDREAPFDGIALTAEFEFNGIRHEDHGVMQPVKWPREALLPALENVRKARFQRVTHNFVRVNGPQKKIDWFDDAKWEAVVANVSNMAWFAKEAGLKGICYDPEQYASHQYTWDAESDKSFEETAAIVRKRGAQMMAAIGKEYPDITIWALWLYSKTIANVEPSQTNRRLSGMGYNLWPAFLNGWMDALPERARLVDGMEDAYYFQDIAEVADTYAVLKNPHSLLLAGILAPEHREKYARQVSISFGLYVDAYTGAPDSTHALGPLRGITRLQRMRQTLSQALEIADDYVWLYNENIRWWPIQTPTWQPGGRFYETSLKTPGKGRVAEEAFPGITELVNLARTPQVTAPQWVERNRAQLQNRLANADLKARTSDGLPEHWWSYGDGLKGRLSVRETDAGDAISFTGVKGGLLAQNLTITPGRLYYISAQVKQNGSGELALNIRWQSSNGKWNNILRDQAFMPEQKQDAWQPLTGVVMAPQGSAQMVLYFSVNNQRGENDQALIKDIEVYEIH